MALGDSTFRVSARMLNDLDGSSRRCRTTLPPWAPVAPKTAISRLVIVALGIVAVEKAAGIVMVGTLVSIVAGGMTDSSRSSSVEAVVSIIA